MINRGEAHGNTPPPVHDDGYAPVAHGERWGAVPKRFPDLRPEKPQDNSLG